MLEKAKRLARDHGSGSKLDDPAPCTGDQRCKQGYEQLTQYKTRAGKTELAHRNGTCDYIVYVIPCWHKQKN